MITARKNLKNILVSLGVAGTFLVSSTAQANPVKSWTNANISNNLWQTADNWLDTNDATGVPYGSTGVKINLSGANGVLADATSTGTSEYIRIGDGGSGELTIDGADMDTRDLNRANYIGDGSGNTGILNMVSGNFDWRDRTYIANGSADGTVNHTGGNLTFSEFNSQSTSVVLGSTNGTGTYNFTAGNLEIARKIDINAGGSSTTTFNVFGYDVASSIQIGGTTYDTDGAWDQGAGATLSLFLDGGTSQGTTLINIGLASADEPDNTNDGKAVFASGSLLDLGFMSGAQSGTWTVMTAAGGIVDNGLTFASGVNDDPNEQWSYAVVGNDLQVTAVVIPEPTSIALMLIVGATLLVTRRRRKA